MPEPSAADHARIARELRSAEAAAAPIAPLAGDLTLADAYAIQRHGRELRLAAGERLMGRKVGLTSAAMQEMLGVDQPDYGCLFEAMVLRDGVTIAADLLIAPRVEAEIAFVLDRDLAGPGVTRDDVLAATGEVLPAIEVIDSRIADWKITIVDTIADNASSAMAVVGEPRPLDGLDLRAIEMTLTAGGASETGRGDAVLGHPAEPVAWLANTLAEHGERLEAGDLVLPGALGRAVPVAAGDEVRADLGPLGVVTARFE